MMVIFSPSSATPQMTQTNPHLFPEPDHFLHHHHLLLQSSMGEQTLLPQTHNSSSPSNSAAAVVSAGDGAAATATANAAPSSGDLSSSSSADPPTSAAAAKIPLRPRKIRKVSTPSAAPPAATPDDPSKNNSTIVVPPAPRVAVRVLPRPLSAEGEIAAALRHLRAVDPHLARVIDAHEAPAFQCLQPPFHSLARSILYQQLAYKAAASIYARFLGLCGGEAGVVPEAVLALTPQQLRQIGVSARKASYLHDLARKYHARILSDASIVAMDDKSLFSMLTMVKGIGAWSVHMFMIFSLHRPDVLPVGDLGVRKGVQMLYGLVEVPRPSQMEQLCEQWRPYRSVGAWYMWRLVESRSNPNLASPGTTPSTTAVGLPIDNVPVGAGVVGSMQQQQQPQMIDPIQMLPDLG